MTDAPKIDTTTETANLLTDFVEVALDPSGAADLIRVLLAERDLAAAQTAAAVMEMRESAAEEAEEELYFEVADAIRELPLPDGQAALDRMIADRVREAVEAERDACAQILAEMALAYDKAEDQGRPVALMVARNAIAARGSKEGQS